MNDQSTPAILNVNNITKKFCELTAVNQVSFDIKPGECFALLGANGAGKTTSLKMITGLLKPDEGNILINGADVVGQSQLAKEVLAYLPDEPLLYDKLYPMEYLQFVSKLWNMDGKIAKEKGEALLNEMGLWEKRNHYCENLSRGMRQKVALCGALIHDPKLLVMDEPLTGLDFNAANQIKKTFETQLETGMSILVTTHIIDIAEKMAHRIGVLNKGVIAACGTSGELKSMISTHDANLEDTLITLSTDQNL